MPRCGRERPGLQNATLLVGAPADVAPEGVRPSAPERCASSSKIRAGCEQRPLPAFQQIKIQEEQGGAETRAPDVTAPSEDRRCEHDTGATRTAPYTVRPGGPFLGKRSRILAWVTRELARNSECSTPVRPFYGQGGHVVFPAPSGLNGQTKRSERRPAGRARRAPAPGAGPQWAPRVPWGTQPKKARHADKPPASQLRRSLPSQALIEYCTAHSLRRRRP